MAARKIPCVIMRGGTSKGVFFHDRDLPRDEEERDLAILRAFGSPDRRQIDGLGGANSSTSKVAIIKKSDRPGFDIDYTFGQVSITDPLVEKNGNCGNISSAVGPFAVDEGLVEAIEPVTTVRIFNTNTEKGMTAYVPVRDGQTVYEGDFSISGVPGTAAKIDIAFDSPAGAATGRKLPSGKPMDILTIRGREYRVSLVDGANPMVYVMAEDLPVRGTVLPWEYERLPDYREIDSVLHEIRRWGAVQCGFVDSEDKADEISPMTPKVGFISAPAAYTDATGRRIGPEEHDLSVRFLSMGKMIHAFMGTGAICTEVAANTEGTIVREVIGKDGPVTRIRIAHPFGIMNVSGRVAADGEVEQAVIERTARRIMEGSVFV